MSCLLDIFSGYSMKNFITKHMTYGGRHKDQCKKQTTQSCTIATLMSLKDGTLSKQRQITLNDDDELSDISIDSAHFDSTVSCNEVNGEDRKSKMTPTSSLKTKSTLRIDQIRDLNESVGGDDHLKKDNPDNYLNVNLNDSYNSNSDNLTENSSGNVMDCQDLDSKSCILSESHLTNENDTCSGNFLTIKSVQKNLTLPSNSKAKTLLKVSKPKKASKNYSHSLPNGKKKRKSTEFQKDLKFQTKLLSAAGFREDFESNITQIYNSCNEKWTTIINLDSPLQSPPKALEDPNNSVGVIVFGLEDSIQSGITMPSDDDRNGRAHVVRWLLWNSAADMPALERSTSGALALHYASARGCLDCVKLLVETSLELSANSQMDNDVTPVYLAAQEGHLDVLKFLVLEAGGSLYVRAKDGMAPIHAAAQMGCLGCLKWMVRDQGVDPNLKDGDGATPLHFAASRGHADCVRWLLRYGGKLMADKFGKSPINDAAENQQMECLSLLVQHGTLPDYHEEAKLHGKLHGCVCRKGESTKCSYADCVNYTPNSEPFYLHPPLSSSKPAPASRGLYINPMTNHNHPVVNDPFYLHNPQELMYNRVKDLFDSGGNRLQGQQPSSLSSSSVSSSPSPPPPPPQPMTVKVEVHSSSSGAGSEESSDLSERGSRNGDHDYEDIYSLQGGGATEAVPGRKMTRSRSRDSGSHSRSGSVSSTNSNVVVTISASGGTSANQPCPQPGPIMCKLARDDMHTSEESGVSSASPSDLGHSEEEGEKVQQHAQTLKHRNQTNNRMLKRVVSDSGVMVPPPPPPLPDDTSMTSSGNSSTEEEQSLDSSATLVEERPLQRTSTDNTALVLHTPEPSPVPGSQDHNAPALINKQKALPFIPPKFPNTGDDSNALIKPSEYLKSICGAKQSTLRRSTSEMTLTSDSLRESNKLDVPPPPPLPLNQAEENAKEKQSHQPLATISIQDLNSVQLRRTVAGKTMSVPLSVPGLPTNVPFSNQKNDLIAELKMSRDIIGIKKMKVERVKMEEKQEKEIMSEISRQFSVDVFVDKVGNIPEKDGNGLPIPPWKRQMLAKKAAEKAKKELEEQLAREAEEKRLQAIPAWKRQLMQSKKGDDTKSMKSSMHISIEENKTSVIVLEKHSGGESQNYGEENNKENSNPRSETKVEPIPEEAEEDCTPIMPWRSQLRKTNSTLNLLE